MLVSAMSRYCLAIKVHENYGRDINHTVRFDSVWTPYEARLPALYTAEPTVNTQLLRLLESSLIVLNNIQ